MAMLKGSGLLSQQEVQGLTPDFDPMDVSRTRMASQKMREQLRAAAAQQEKQAMEDRRLQLKIQEEMGRTAREQQRLDLGERRLESSERRADRREALQERAQQGTEEYRRWQEQRAEAADQAAMARREQMQTQQQATGARQDESLWIRKWSEMYKDPITGGPKEGAPSLEDFIKEHKASAYRQKQVQASGIDIDKERSDAMAEIARSKTPERKEKIRAMFKDVTGEDL
jgi:hypothetical protein